MEKKKFILWRLLAFHCAGKVDERVVEARSAEKLLLGELIDMEKADFLWYYFIVNHEVVSFLWKKKKSLQKPLCNFPLIKMGSLKFMQSLCNETF